MNVINNSVAYNFIIRIYFFLSQYFTNIFIGHILFIICIITVMIKYVKTETMNNIYTVPG